MVTIIKRILNIAGKDKKSLILGMFINILENFMIFVPYILLFYFLNLFMLDELSENSVVAFSIIMIISIILRCIFRRCVDGLQSPKGLNIFAKQRIKFVDHLKKIPMGYFTEDNMGNIVSILTTDIIFMEENAMSFLGQLVSAYISIAMCFVFMFKINIWLGVTYAVIILVAYIAIKKLDKVNKIHGKIRQDEFGILSNSVVQFVKGLATVKAFGMENDDNVDLARTFNNVKDKALEFEKKYFFPRISTDLTNSLGIAALIIIDTILYFSGLITIDYALGMLIFSSICLSSIVVIINGVPRFDILEVGLDRFDSIMAVEELNNKEQNLPELTNNDIKFKDVHFAYSDKDIIKGVSLDIKEKSFAAFVGPSGGGKTTLANLILRFWDVKSGSISIGGIDIREMSLDVLLSKISVVFQNVYLFEDTIANNIAFGIENATRERVIEAAKKAHCHDFVMNMPDGYDTVIAEGGSTLSGGEKQRISIARAIMKDASIVLLDEATSSVDPENELYIQQSINELVKNKTLIVIAHRLSSVINADKIFVVDDGKISERGTHNELIRNNGIYKKMWEYTSECK